MNNTNNTAQFLTDGALYFNGVFGGGPINSHLTIGNGSSGGSYYRGLNFSYNHAHTISVGSTGGSTGHTHGFTGTAINLAVQYVDTIIATKD